MSMSVNNAIFTPSGTINTNGVPTPSSVQVLSTYYSGNIGAGDTDLLTVAAGKRFLLFGVSMFSPAGGYVLIKNTVNPMFYISAAAGLTGQVNGGGSAIINYVAGEVVRINGAGGAGSYICVWGVLETL